MTGRQMVRAAVTYPTAVAAVDLAATAATVPLGPQPPFVITAVWISAAAVAGWLVLLLADRITIRTTNGGSS